MAEDREAFRDLLDRLGQPYAPSFIVEGATQGLRDASADEALDHDRPARHRPAGLHARRARAAASSSPSRPTASGSGPACAPARSAR